MVQVLYLAGVEAQQVVLLLEDYQLVHPTFLEMINSLLSSGKCMISIPKSKNSDVKIIQINYLV